MNIIFFEHFTKHAMYIKCTCMYSHVYLFYTDCIYTVDDTKTISNHTINCDIISNNVTDYVIIMLSSPRASERCQATLLSA